MYLRTCVFVGVAVLAVGMTLLISQPTEAQSQKGYSRDIPGEEAPRVMPKPLLPGGAIAPTAAQELAEEVNKALAAVAAAAAEYGKAIEANRKTAGTIPDAEIERLRRALSDSQFSANSKQIKSLKAEIDELRKQVQELKTVKVLPIVSNGH